MKIKKVIKRECPGAFIVEDDSGNQFFIQLQMQLEEWYQKLPDEQKALIQ